MKSTPLAENDGLRTHLLVLDKGDEAFETVTAFARDNGITAASLTAIGACSGAILGYFDPGINDYRSITYEEQMELASLVGDIAENAGEPALHAHLVLGRRDGSAAAGHLQKLYVFPTMEVVLEETPAHLRKRVDPQTGLALISVDDSHPGD